MQEKQYPFFIKSTVVLFGLILLTYSLINLRDILVPVAFSVIIAILLNPLVNKFKGYKISHVFSIIIAMLIAIVIIAAILYFLSSQIAGFGENIPLLKTKFAALSHQLQEYVQAKFGIAIGKQVQLLNDALNSSKAMVGQTVGTALGTLAVIFLLPVYTFLLLFYKALILNFLYEVFAEENTKQVGDILSQTKTAIQSYMVGLLLEALIVAVLNSTALMILGIDYAILLGVLGAILNMIPYLGGIIAIALPVLMATVTKDGFSSQLGIIIAYAIIQFIDNNILVPRIVSSKVQINALFSIIVVLLGGALWGVPGMFLSIPAVAIVKIIFDRIDDLKPWGKLLGDEVPTRHKGQIWIRRRKKPSVAEKIVE
ncbi:AI-2E family transporter [Segetibacter aerophilus]|uniref:AI-2E family transporter n=1 Tax=Segetibacter aerophilus TaxID=670293 RepID=A0A512B7N2_9BACT|nr:AI-2E family transporter [Segetibacter aerophilus]GEO07973.1 AI-2E family transporter [Segetibacter aerophilus]